MRDSNWVVLNDTCTAHTGTSAKPVSNTVWLGSYLFAYRSSKLPLSTKRNIRALVSSMGGAESITITGYTHSNQKSKAARVANQRLALRRAVAVRTYLRSLHVKAGARPRRRRHQPAGHPLAGKAAVTADDLRGERFVAMRAGYLMYRFAHRLFGSELPASWHSTDGAEMGKMIVAEGIGLTVLPDYSVLGDPLEQAGLIVTRPLAGDDTLITMTALHRRQAGALPAVLQVLEHLRELARHPCRPVRPDRAVSSVRSWRVRVSA